MNVYKDRQLFPYLAGPMLGNSKWLVTISGVEYVEVDSERGKERKLAVRFSETDAPMLANKTNVKRIAALYGPDTEDWIGKAITLYAEDVRAFGTVHRAIRVGPPAVTRRGRGQQLPTADGAAVDQAAHGAPPGAGQHETAQGTEAHGDDLDQGGAGA